MPDIAASIREYAASQNMELSAFAGAGMGLPGPVEADGHIPCCVNLGWKEGREGEGGEESPGSGHAPVDCHSACQMRTFQGIYKDC